MMLSHRVPFDLPRQMGGHVQVGLRAGAAKRAGTLTRSPRSRLWAITAQASQAQLAAN